MELYLARQTLTFFYACLLGALFGALYDVFRILRIARSFRKGTVFLQDLVFFLICAAATFLFLLVQNEGVVRVFLLVGELLGAVLYYCTLGGLVLRAAGPMVRAVKRILYRLGRHIIWPIWRLFYAVVSLILRPMRFLWRNIKKTGQRSRFRLKTQRIVLYNHVIGYWHRNRSRERKKQRESQNNGAEKIP